MSKECSSHSYREAVDMGFTPLSSDEVRSVLGRLALDWPGTGYDLLRRNCCSFCNVLCIELGDSAAKFRMRCFAFPSDVAAGVLRR
eukprot:s2129_g13.t1